MEARPVDYRPRSVRKAEFLKKLYPVYAGTRLYQAFEMFDRWDFTPKGQKSLAYQNRVINLGSGSSISEPLLVARIITLSGLALTSFDPQKTVLEIGTGAGFQTALLSHCAKEIYTIEYNPRLLITAQRILSSLGISNVYFRLGDGLQGWPGHLKFDAIILSAAAKEMPPQLLIQLNHRGKMVIPIGDLYDQELTVATKHHDRITTQVIGKVKFYPLISDETGGFNEEDFKNPDLK